MELREYHYEEMIATEDTERKRTNTMLCALGVLGGKNILYIQREKKRQLYIIMKLNSYYSTNSSQCLKTRIKNVCIRIHLVNGKTLYLGLSPGT